MALNMQVIAKVRFFYWFLFDFILNFMFLVCKIMATELENRFSDTGKSSDVIETGYAFDPDKRKKKKYSVRFVF